MRVGYFELRSESGYNVARREARKTVREAAGNSGGEKERLVIAL